MPLLKSIVNNYYVKSYFVNISTFTYMRSSSL